MAEKTIELLSPAGDMERLRMSLAYLLSGMLIQRRLLLIFQFLID